MSKKATTDVFVRLSSCAGQYFHPRDYADAAFPVARNFSGRRRVAVEEIEQNVAVQQRIQLRESPRAALRRLHSRRSVATCCETFPSVLDAQKNERRSLAGDTRRKRSTARRTASAREIFSRRHNRANFLICSCGRSTIVRTTISSYDISQSQAKPPSREARFAHGTNEQGESLTSPFSFNFFRVYSFDSREASSAGPRRRLTGQAPV
jgi:hypothetical protein